MDGQIDNVIEVINTDGNNLKRLLKNILDVKKFKEKQFGKAIEVIDKKVMSEIKNVYPQQLKVFEEFKIK